MTSIEEFIRSTINQVKAALPEGCSVEGKFEFDLSLVTTKETKGGVDLKVANAETGVNTQNVQRLRFSIIDEVAQERQIAKVGPMLMNMFQPFIDLDKKSKIKKV